MNNSVLELDEMYQSARADRDLLLRTQILQLARAQSEAHTQVRDAMAESLTQSQIANNNDLSKTKIIEYLRQSVRQFFSFKKLQLTPALAATVFALAALGLLLPQQMSNHDERLALLESNFIVHLEGGKTGLEKSLSFESIPPKLSEYQLGAYLARLSFDAKWPPAFLGNLYSKQFPIAISEVLAELKTGSSALGVRTSIGRLLIADDRVFSGYWLASMMIGQRQTESASASPEHQDTLHIIKATVSSDLPMSLSKEISSMEPHDLTSSADNNVFERIFNSLSLNEVDSGFDLPDGESYKQR